MARIALTAVHKIGRKNRPAQSRHELRWVRDLPHRHIRRLPDPLQAFVLPFEPYRADLVHSFGLVPVTRKPWVATFGQFLPRPVTRLDHPLQRFADGRLDLDNCRALIAQSEYARRVCLDRHAGCDHHDALATKMTVVHASTRPVTEPVERPGRQGGINLVFVGLDLARKGGIVALRVASLAHHRGLPITLDIISGGVVSGGWVDHPDASRMDADLALRALPNVTDHGRLPADETQRVIARSDLQVMCTLDDNFGYSVTEGFAHGVPTIGTTVGALPEIIEDGVSGLLVPLPTNALGQWTGRERYGAVTDDEESASQHRRNTDEYWELLDRTWDDLAAAVLDRLEVLLDDRDQLDRLRAGAKDAADGRFSPELAARRLDDIYDEALDV